MDTFRRLEDFPARRRRCVVSIGKFDGLHRGHAAILSKVVETARSLDASAVAFTFDPSPAQVLRPETAAPPLCGPDQKIELFESFGLDALILFPTTREFLQTSARDFFEQVVVGSLGAVALVEGSDFRFGSDRGSDEQLAKLCCERKIRLDIVKPVEEGGACVSSSLVRSLISSGDVESARELLGRPFETRGIVERGDMRGRTLGFPTANLGASGVALPKSALYAAAARLEDGSVYPAAVNLGGNPTFGVDVIKIEAHLVDFHGDLYGKPLSVSYLQKIRDVVKFNSREELIAQMNRDLEAVRAIFRRYFPRAC
ncbi:MAG: riboflavin biosynthesis protein RibF [Thermoguttaceae bacterium]|nr:riboflavin biosynthesis protein RibF [Thermoguttaceae bacterium]